MAETSQAKSKKSQDVGCMILFTIIFLFVLLALSADFPTDSEREADLEEFRQGRYNYQQDQETYDALQDLGHYIEYNKDR